MHSNPLWKELISKKG
jgi:hypothetical protein